MYETNYAKERSASLSTVVNPNSYMYPAPSTSFVTDTDISILCRGSQAITTERCRALLAYTALEDASVLPSDWFSTQLCRL